MNDDTHETIVAQLNKTNDTLNELYPNTTRWDITWGAGTIETRPWPRFRNKWKARFRDAWAVLRGNAFIQEEDYD